MTHCKLNAVQFQAVSKVAKAEARTVEQVLSLLLAEGISFYFCDYSSPNIADDERLEEGKLVDLLREDAQAQVGR